LSISIFHSGKQQVLSFFSNSSLEIKSDLEEEEEGEDEEEDEEATNLRWQCYKRFYNCNLRESVGICNS
jgi:hypothetical protein